MAKAILYDATKCTACRACQVACKQWNELPAEVTINRGTYENPPDLSPHTWIKIKFIELEKEGKLDWLFARQACMHCTNAACVEVCPTGALSYNELGFVQYEKDKCCGCGYCAEFCPFGVPRLESGKITGVGVMDKCIFCIDRVTNGLEPACVKTCPTGALTFGDRDDLAAEGRARVEALKADGFSNAYLYGDEELGGLHVLYVLADRPSVYGLPEEPEFPVLASVRDNIFRPLAWMTWGVVAAGLALNVVVARARQLSGKEES